MEKSQYNNGAQPYLPYAQPQAYNAQPVAYGQPYPQPVYLVSEPVVVDPSLRKSAFVMGWFSGFGAGPLGALAALFFTPAMCGPSYPAARARSGVFWGIACVHWFATAVVLACFAVIPYCYSATADSCKYSSYSQYSSSAVCDVQSLCGVYSIMIAVIASIYGFFAIGFSVAGYMQTKHDKSQTA
ncbi:hypothetical protein HK098_000851 [Nowakowskiella sp. JEL0407]|nr:hypothetical protein HK098_000851 [Nowakowskiella sp. JEL0407]